MKKQKQLRILTGLFIIVMLFITIGCNHQSPVEPVDYSIQNDISEEYGFRRIKFKHQGFKKEFEATKTITPWGGQIKVGDYTHGYSSLTFLPVSVSQTVQVRFWWESTGFLEGGSEFSPHGLQFNSPVLLRLSYKDADLAGVNELGLKIYYFNDNLNEWEALPSIVNPVQKEVIAWLEHFSRYALGDTP
jgi:hypothetical protein